MAFDVAGWSMMHNSADHHVWHYTTSDPMSEVSTPGYFDIPNSWGNLFTNDVIEVVAGDECGALRVVERTAPGLHTLGVVTLDGRVNEQGWLLSTLTGRSHTLELKHANAYVRTTNAQPVTIIVPPESEVPFQVNDDVHIRQSGIGQVTIQEGTGVTVTTATTRKLLQQFSGALLVKTGTDAWSIRGELEAA